VLRPVGQASGPATLGGGLSVRGGAGVVGDLSVTGKTQVDAIVSSGPGQLGSLAVSNDAQVQGALSVAQSAHVNGDLGVGGSAQVAAINVNGPGTVDSLTVGREASIGGGLSVANGETVGGDVSVSGALAVSGPARLSKGTSVDGARVTGSTLVSPTVEGQASVASLQVTDDGASTRLQGLDVAQAANLHGAVTAGDI